MGTYNFDTFIYVNADKYGTRQKEAKLYVPIDTEVGGHYDHQPR